LPETRTLSGVIAAIVTPVTAGGQPDVDRLIHHGRYLFERGCDGLNVLGTTGEATSFAVAQRMAVMEAVAHSGLDRSRLMVGTGAAAVADAEALTRRAAELGFAGALVLPPFYYKGVPEDGIVRYFERLVAATRAMPIPLYLYNFPALSGVAYTVPLVSRLTEEFGGRIAGLKDSSGDLDYARSVAALPAGLDVFPSNEKVLGLVRAGSFAGCISATVNVNAGFCRAALHAGDDGALESAVRIRTSFDGKQLVPWVKAVVAHLHGDQTYARALPPFVEPPQAEVGAFLTAYDKLASTGLP
jgi:4-hydroxy-tetrahydrodipicolinate synthase